MKDFYKEAIRFFNEDIYNYLEYEPKIKPYKKINFMLNKIANLASLLIFNFVKLLFGKNRANYFCLNIIK